MSKVISLPFDSYGYGFVPPEYLPPGKDEYWLRNSAVRDKTWRALTPGEREILAANNNTCSDWTKFLVRDPFDPSLIRDSHFYGLVRIGTLRKVLLQHHDFRVPAGIRNSTIISCDIGCDTAIRDCGYISHYVIGDNCVLSRIDEMQTTNHAKFGSGSVKDGEEENVRVWIDVMNEAGGRSVLAFRDMIPADAFLWAAYRDDTALVERLKNITQKEYGGRRGAYGSVGSFSVIKSCRIIKDMCVGEWAYIKGANKLKNISVLSSEDEPSQIGEGVEMVNGIVGFGCRAFYGVKAVRFVMGRGSSLKYGARLIHSVLGDNSNVSCCEMLNNLVFPFHEQHHNNSFLIASMIQGMSNMAAGATLGSNHNSRANDGEIRAGRGFWPGLSTSVKHSSRFASFVLLAKGDFPHELHIPLPFSLVNNNARLDRLEIMPAYFWMHNLYALERNSWKVRTRDRRVIKAQRVETDYLAPDSAEEIIAALSLMENWMKDAGIEAEQSDTNDDDVLRAPGLEKHSRSSVLLKPRRARAAYREMLRYYSLKTLAGYLEEKLAARNPGESSPAGPENNPAGKSGSLRKSGTFSYADFTVEMEAAPEGISSGRVSPAGRRVRDWVNLGGQITPAFRVDDARARIREGSVDSWEGIHAFYDEAAAAYARDKARHAWEVYRCLEQAPGSADRQGESAAKHPLVNPERFKEELAALVRIRRSIAAQIESSRARDFSDPFRKTTYRNRDEMEQVIGTAANNPFIAYIREETARREKSAETLSSLL